MNKINFKKMIAEIQLYPDSFFPDNPTHSTSNSSANNYTSKFKNNKRYNFIRQIRHESQNHVQTPIINTRYNLTLRKLDSNICSLKNRYADLLDQYMTNKNLSESYQKKFVSDKYRERQKMKAKKEMEKKKEAEKKEMELKRIKNKKKEEEKMVKMRNSNEIKNRVEKLKIKIENDSKKYSENKRRNIINKQKIAQEEKKYIQNRKKQMVYINLQEEMKKKKLKEQKEKQRAEMLQGNQVLTLRKIKNELESKIKVLNTINNTTRKKDTKILNVKINLGDSFKNPESVF